MGRLSVGPTVDQVREVGRLVEGDGVVEIPSVHHGGVSKRSICAGPQPGQVLLKGDSLWDGERPVDGIQLGVSIDATVVLSKVDTIREADSVAVQCDHNLDFTQPLSTTTLQEEKNGAALGVSSKPSPRKSCKPCRVLMMLRHLNHFMYLFI